MYWTGIEEKLTYYKTCFDLLSEKKLLKPYLKRLQQFIRNEMSDQFLDMILMIETIRMSIGKND